MQIFFSVFWITLTIINCYQVMFCHNNNKVFLFCLPKRCSWSRDRLKKGGSGSRLRPTTKNRLRLHPKSGGFGSATLGYADGLNVVNAKRC